MEHRWGARSKLDIPVQVDCGSQARVFGVMRNASVSGSFLCTAAQLPMLTCVSVELISPRCRTHVGVQAYVVRRTPEGFGLEWSEIAPAPIVEALCQPVEALCQPGAMPLHQIDTPPVTDVVGPTPEPQRAERREHEEAAL